MRRTNALSASGVWLGTDNGQLFLPLSDDGLPSGDETAPESRDAESPADREALDAACLLMPSLPREFIAEVLQLGPHRPAARPPQPQHLEPA